MFISLTLMGFRIKLLATGIMEEPSQELDATKVSVPPKKLRPKSLKSIPKEPSLSQSPVGPLPEAEVTKLSDTETLAASALSELEAEQERLKSIQEKLIGTMTPEQLRALFMQEMKRLDMDPIKELLINIRAVSNPKDQAKLWLQLFEMLGQTPQQREETDLRRKSLEANSGVPKSLTVNVVKFGDMTLKEAKEVLPDAAYDVFRQKVDVKNTNELFQKDQKEKEELSGIPVGEAQA